MNKNKESILNYLKEVVTLKYKTYYRYTDDDTVIWFDDIPENEFCTSVAKSKNFDSDVWLKIRKMREPQVPPVPSVCEVWIIEETLKNVDDQPQLYIQIVQEIGYVNEKPEIVSIEKHREEKYSYEEIRKFEQQTEGQAKSRRQVLCLSQETEIQEAWEEYVDSMWRPWKENYVVWKETEKVYKQVYMVYQEHIKSSEDYELLLSLGQINWVLPESQITISRHLITIPARLEFTPRSGRFDLVTDTNGSECKLEYDMLDRYVPSNISDIKSLLDTTEGNLLNNEVSENVLRALVNSIADGGGTYDNSLKPSKYCSNRPTVYFAPAIVFRK